MASIRSKGDLLKSLSSALISHLVVRCWQIHQSCSAVFNSIHLVDWIESWRIVITTTKESLYFHRPQTFFDAASSFKLMKNDELVRVRRRIWIQGSYIVRERELSLWWWTWQISFKSIADVLRAGVQAGGRRHISRQSGPSVNVERRASGRPEERERLAQRQIATGVENRLKYLNGNGPNDSENSSSSSLLFFLLS